MNIGIVTTWFERGAAYVSRQYRDVLKSEHNVYIYARAGESYAIGDPSWDKEHVTWAEGPGIPISTAIYLADFQNWLEKHQIELVFFNEQHWWEPVILCNKLGLKTGAYIDYYTEDTIPLFANYDFLICNTKRHYSVFDWHPQCLYIRWGTDLNLFKPEKYGAVSEGLVTFFHSCGFSPERKGTDYLLRGFYEMQAENSRLVIHSQVNLLERIPQLGSLINELVSNEKLEIIEKTVSAPGLYNLGDVYVYPSRLDGLGLTMMEALAMGLPVITSDNAPMNEFVKHGENGRLVKIDKFVSRSDGYYWPQSFINLNNLKEQMQWYIENQAHLRSFKENARKYALQYLDWKINAKGLPILFSSLKKQPRGNILAAEEQATKYDNERLGKLLVIERKYPELFKIASIGIRIYKRARTLINRN